MRKGRKRGEERRAVLGCPFGQEVTKPRVGGGKRSKTWLDQKDSLASGYQTMVQPPGIRRGGEKKQAGEKKT